MRIGSRRSSSPEGGRRLGDAAAVCHRIFCYDPSDWLSWHKIEAARHRGQVSKSKRDRQGVEMRIEPNQNDVLRKEQVSILVNQAPTLAAMQSQNFVPKLNERDCPQVPSKAAEKLPVCLQFEAKTMPKSDRDQ